MIRRRTRTASSPTGPAPARPSAASRKGAERAEAELLAELAGAPKPRPVARRHPSYERIYAVVKRIPAGRVATYGQIAALAGLPGHARQVGYALNKTPAGRALPWHRVLNARGECSLPGSGGDEQRRLLRREGVALSREGRVDLKRFQWRPRGSTP